MKRSIGEGSEIKGYFTFYILNLENDFVVYLLKRTSIKKEMMYS